MTIIAKSFPVVVDVLFQNITRRSNTAQIDEVRNSAIALVHRAIPIRRHTIQLIVRDTQAHSGSFMCNNNKKKIVCVLLPIAAAHAYWVPTA